MSWIHFGAVFSALAIASALVYRIILKQRHERFVRARCVEAAEAATLEALRRTVRDAAAEVGIIVPDLETLGEAHVRYWAERITREMRKPIGTTPYNRPARELIEWPVLGSETPYVTEYVRPGSIVTLGPPAESGSTKQPAVDMVKPETIADVTDDPIAYVLRNRPIPRRTR